MPSQAAILICFNLLTLWVIVETFRMNSSRWLRLFLFINVTITLLVLGYNIGRWLNQ